MMSPVWSVVFQMRGLAQSLVGMGAFGSDIRSSPGTTFLVHRPTPRLLPLAMSQLSLLARKHGRNVEEASHLGNCAWSLQQSDSSQPSTCANMQNVPGSTTSLRQNITLHSLLTFPCVRKTKGRGNASVLSSDFVPLW